MNRDNLATKLRHIKALAEEALKEIENRPNEQTKSRVSVTKLAFEKTLPAHILRLREAGFFKQAKASKEVHAKLQPIYPCDLDRVAMALMRLHRRKAVRKTSKLVGKEKLIAYVW